MFLYSAAKLCLNLFHTVYNYFKCKYLKSFSSSPTLFLFDNKRRKRMKAHQSHNDRLKLLQQEDLIRHRMYCILKVTHLF